MFGKIGNNIDNKIQDIKEWGYGTRIYRIYSGLKIPKYIRKFENIDALNKFLSYCLKNKWITEKSAQKYREKWLSMMKKNCTNS